MVVVRQPPRGCLLPPEAAVNAIAFAERCAADVLAFPVEHSVSRSLVSKPDSIDALFSSEGLK